MRFPILNNFRNLKVTKRLNIVQESMNRCTGRRDITEILLTLNTIQQQLKVIQRLSGGLVNPKSCYFLNLDSRMEKKNGS